LFSAYSSCRLDCFYTAGPNECELLKQPSSGWTYEGIAFRALVPTKGSCYPGAIRILVAAAHSGRG
jgi:hypothetical protein